MMGRPSLERLTLRIEGRTRTEDELSLGQKGRSRREGKTAAVERILQDETEAAGCGDSHMQAQPLEG